MWLRLLTAWRAVAVEEGTALLYLPLVRAGRATDAVASWSAPLALSPVADALWIVNPDADSVSVLDTTLLATTAEIAVGHEPWALAIAPDGARVFVVNRADGTLMLLAAGNHGVEATLTVGSEPAGIALSPLGISPISHWPRPAS